MSWEKLCLSYNILSPMKRDVNTCMCFFMIHTHIFIYRWMDLIFCSLSSSLIIWNHYEHVWCEQYLPWPFGSATQKSWRVLWSTAKTLLEESVRAKSTTSNMNERNWLTIIFDWWETREKEEEEDLMDIISNTVLCSLLMNKWG